MRELNPPFRREGPVSLADRRTGHVECDAQELNLQILRGWLGYGQLGLPMPNRRMLFAVAQAGVEPADHEGLSFAGLRTTPLHSQAPSTGFGPAISCVTGRRALQAAPRGHVHVPVAQVGVEPGTAAQRWSHPWF